MGDDWQLDGIMPVFDVQDAHTRRIHAPPQRLYAALTELRADEVPLMGLLMGIRTLPVRGARQRRPVAIDQPLLTAMRHGGFTLLAEQPDREIVLGIIEQFWRLRGGATYRVRDAGDYMSFATPGFAKAAIAFQVQPQGAITLITTETRILATDPDLRRAFARYWRLIYPGSALIRWAWLRALQRRAEAD